MTKRTGGEIVEIPRHELTETQLAVIELLIKGKSDQEAADTVQVTKVTVAKWRRYDVWFVAELNRRRQADWSVCGERLRAMLPRALDVLEAELSGKNALAASAQLFRLAGFQSGAPRGQTDADAEIDKMAKQRR